LMVVDRSFRCSCTANSHRKRGGDAAWGPLCSGWCSDQHYHFLNAKKFSDADCHRSALVFCPSDVSWTADPTHARRSRPDRLAPGPQMCRSHFSPSSSLSSSPSPPNPPILARVSSRRWSSRELQRAALRRSMWGRALRPEGAVCSRRKIRVEQRPARRRRRRARHAKERRGTDGVARPS
jgi:hypothetical protein